MTKLVDDAQERARACHLKYQEYDDLANKAEVFGDLAIVWYYKGLAQSSLNDFFYWIGHANAYRGIAMQVEMWEEIDAEPSCP